MNDKYHPSMQQHALAIATYCLASFAWFYPLLRDMSGKLYGSADAWNYAWRIWWFAGGYHSWGNDPFYAPQIFYPFGHYVAEAELTPLQMIPAAIVSKLSGPVFAYNVLVWTTFIISAYVMYLYLRRIRISHVGALIGGLVFGFCPYHSVHAYGHLPLMGIWALPLGALAIEGLAETIDTLPSRRKALLWAALLGLAVGFAGWSSWYYLVIMGVALAIYALVRFRGPRNERRAIPWRALMLALLIAILMVIPFYYLSVTKSGAPAPDWGVTAVKGAAPIAYVLPYPYQRWWGSLTQGVFTRNPVEDSLFLGWVPLLLAGWGWWRYRREKAVVKGLTITLWSGFVLSLGPFLYMGPRLPVTLPIEAPNWLLARFDVSEMVRLPIPLPALPLVFLPVFSGMREYTRFGVVVMFCVAALAAFGMDAAVEKWTRVEHSRVLRVVTACVVAVAVLVEFAPVPMTQPSGPTLAESWLAENVDDGVIFYLPETRHIADQAMFKTTYTGLPIACGDATILPEEYLAALVVLEGFPDEASRDVLQDLGVTHIIWRTNLVADLPSADWLDPVAEFEDQAVFELR